MTPLPLWVVSAEAAVHTEDSTGCEFILPGRTYNEIFIKNQTMASEKKATSLFLGKTSEECQDQKEKIVCSKSAVSWVLAAVLLSLLVVLITQFFYPPYEQKIRIYEEQPIELRVVPPTYEDGFYEGKTQGKSNPTLEFPWDSEFLIDPVDLCATLNPPDSVEYDNNPEVKLLMLVPSAVNHFEQRKAIRKTWGSVAGRPFGPMRLGFVLGTTDDATLGDLVRRESGDFRDIIQADFVDGYRQLTTKSVLALKWVSRRCAHAQFFLKADDDTFVNVGAIARILGGEPYASREKFIGGHVKTEVRPTPDMAVYIDIAVDDFPPSVYPPFASGSAYVMTVPTAMDLLDAARETEPFLPRDEDAFLTGLCAQHADVPLIHEPTFVIDDLPSPPSWDAYSTLTTAHSVTPDILEQVWKEMTQTMADSLFYFESAINSTVHNRKKKNLALVD